jgi:hypothetical protein
MLESVDNESNVLLYWCFLKMHTMEGTVVVDVFHPGGLEKASELIELIVDEITTCSHRVNQLLLLISLNNTRLASNLLVPDLINNPNRETDAINDPDIALRFNDSFV